MCGLKSTTWRCFRILQTRIEEKSMQKENRVKENWCESVSKELVVFNKAFIRRAGAGLFPFIVLEGSKEAINYCVTTEAKLFYDAGTYSSDKVYNTKDLEKKNRGVYFIGIWNEDSKDVYTSLASEGSLLFFTTDNVQKANRYSVNGCEILSFKAAFMPVIAMECSDEVLSDALKLYPFIKDMDMLEVSNNTVLAHYENYDDDIIHKDDFDWAKNYSNAPVNEKSENKEDNEDTKNEKAEPENKSSKKSETNVNSAPVKPAKKKVSDETAKKNMDLLNNVREKYQKIIDYIEEVNTSMWKPVEKFAKQALETNDFSESIIMNYLNISQDVTTDLYRMLYDEIEPARKDFEDNVVRSYKKITCFNCREEWEVDVTFLGEKQETCECPKCNTTIRYDKD